MRNKNKQGALKMGSDNQTQKAGDNSQQNQAKTMIVNNYNGISEERARDIFMEMSKRVISENANEASNIWTDLLPGNMVSLLTVRNPAQDTGCAARYFCMMVDLPICFGPVKKMCFGIKVVFLS